MKALGMREWGILPQYDDLVESFEYEVLVDVSDDGCQGDSLYLLRAGESYGYLTFGWGSCSGCDALEACEGLAEATELRDELHDSIQWDSKEGMRAALTERDWEVTFLSSTLVKEFLDKALPLL